MINSTPAEFVFIRACILFLQAVTPFSLAYTCCEAASWYTTWQLPLRLPILLRIWLAIETVFYFGFQVPYLFHIQRDAIHPPLQSRDARRELFRRSFADHSHDRLDLERHIRRWFKGATVDEIGREGVKSWLAWAFFEGRIDAFGKDAQELEDYTQQVERLLGQRFPGGKGTATPLRLTLDPIDVRYRSLWWYFCVGFVDMLTYLRLCQSGYHFHRQPLRSFFTLFPFRPIALTASKRSPVEHITYWHRPHTSKTRLPVLFIHGIGIGLYPYVDFLRDLNEHVDDGEADGGQIGILAVEIMPISFRITHAALDKETMCNEITRILEHHGIAKCVLVSHSYGTVLTTHILHNPTLSHKVDSVLLVDPVTFLLHNPDVAYNFTVRKPIHANEYQLWYFASQDPGVAHTLGRRFFWSENVLWIEDVRALLRRGMRVSVSLADRDLIVDTQAVSRYLAQGVDGSAAFRANCDDMGAPEGGLGNAKQESSQRMAEGLQVLWHDDTDHGQVFEKRSKRARLVKVVRTYCEATS